MVVDIGVTWLLLLLLFAKYGIETALLLKALIVKEENWYNNKHDLKWVSEVNNHEYRQFLLFNVKVEYQNVLFNCK